MVLLFILLALYASVLEGSLQSWCHVISRAILFSTPPLAVIVCFLPSFHLIFPVTLQMLVVCLFSWLTYTVLGCGINSRGSDDSALGLALQTELGIHVS